MDKAIAQGDRPLRRRSMLPQKTSIKPFSKPMGSFPEQDGYEAEGQPAALGEIQASAVSPTAQNKAATMLPSRKLLPYAGMPPPVSLGRTSSKRDSAKIGHLPRQPSTSRKSSRGSNGNGAYPSQDHRNLSQPRLPVRTSSTGSDPQSNARESYHGRSLSQQVRPTATSNPLPSKVFTHRESSIKHPRPAFSAMQQHFSPKKNRQPDPPILSSQPASKDEIPSAEVLDLQMEMAQLHLLHRSALSVQVQWEKSAKRSFEHRFSALYEQHTELKEVAHQQQSLINQSSLVQWSQGRSGVQIAEKAQLLSHNLSEICNLLDSEGKYTHILNIFESWFAQALRVRGQRESNGRKTGRDFDFIEGIGDGWKAEAMVLERELTYSARDLESFGEVQSPSNLCRILSMYRKLIIGLLEELDLIQWIENEVMNRETSWVESAIRNLASNVSEDIGSMGPDRKAA
ncbi:hypothetical protein HO133_004658 [Letharia lupina]|uniref:Uncharacterized protein n=1 Tax=Letharia lupina TaxID=560253 RepID=A0A8H6FKQ6_9LECA|nr:uncharacterized protein HO133_004658 [Letharia lupina]KAF6230318.1 hypothetical protein HO133_004658 [Letharia lupina]